MSREEFDERYATELLEPGNESYMLATVCSTIHNEFAFLRGFLEALAAEGKTRIEVPDEHINTADDYLPKIKDATTPERVETSTESIAAFHRQAATRFG